MIDSVSGFYWFAGAEGAQDLLKEGIYGLWVVSGSGWELYEKLRVSVGAFIWRLLHFSSSTTTT